MGNAISSPYASAKEARWVGGMGTRRENPYQCQQLFGSAFWCLSGFDQGCLAAGELKAAAPPKGATILLQELPTRGRSTQIQPELLIKATLPLLRMVPEFLQHGVT